MTVPSYQDDNRRFYEDEALRRTRQPLRGRRVELRSSFIGLLTDEGRSSVVDFGAGPGWEAHAYDEAGVRYVGIDLAHGNAMLAAERGVPVVQGSLAAPPLRPASFDAGICMSTLMHLTDSEVPIAVQAMKQALIPGSPLLVAQWGGSDGDQLSTGDSGHQRFFGLRSIDHNTELLSAIGTIERSEVWDVDPADWEYHVIVVRT